MDREETKTIIKAMRNAYSDMYKRTTSMQDLSDTIDSYWLFLSEYNYTDVVIALKTYGTNSGSDFAPSPSKLIEYINKPKDLTQMDAVTAWTAVRKAISRGSVHSSEDFAKLPRLAQLAVGSAEQLHVWATDENFNESVVSSNFMRNFAIVSERQKDMERLPVEAKAKMDRLIELQKDTAAQLECRPERMLIEAPEKNVTPEGVNYSELLMEQLEQG